MTQLQESTMRVESIYTLWWRRSRKMSTVQQAKREQRVKRRQQRGRWDSFTDWARTQAGVFLMPIARAMGRLGIHPNTITILGLLLQIGVGVVFGLGYITLGGRLLLVVAPVDALDGALARALEQRSRFGAFLDSTLDRLSDAALILGLTVHYLHEGVYLEVILLLIALVAALMVSYTRARAEALGFPCKVGLLTRLERIVLIGALTAVGLPIVMIWALALLSVFTMIQRILYVYAVSRQDEAGGE
ncbi:MAG: CDP-alcohol phosphatidyltransferase family protein [Chloroflexota bacterium]|nr:MAG: CDP-alcohol phosphatidyltransferase family protein [Chloroflexota bacterium]